MDKEGWLGNIAFVGTLLAGVIVILKNLKEALTIFNLKPLLVVISFIGSIVVPNGILVWYWMYIAAIYASRMAEAQVFLWLVFQLTVMVSVYTFCWGKWLYPKLNVWLNEQLGCVILSEKEGNKNKEKVGLRESDHE